MIFEHPLTQKNYVELNIMASGQRSVFIYLEPIYLNFICRITCSIQKAADKAKSLLYSPTKEHYLTTICIPLSITSEGCLASLFGPTVVFVCMVHPPHWCHRGLVERKGNPAAVRSLVISVDRKLSTIATQHKYRHHKNHVSAQQSVQAFADLHPNQGFRKVFVRGNMCVLVLVGCRIQLTRT